MSGFFGGGGTAPSNLVGATSSVAGTAGLVPAPAAGDQNKALTGGGIFKASERRLWNTQNTSTEFKADYLTPESFFVLSATLGSSGSQGCTSFTPYYLPESIAITALAIYVGVGDSTASVDVALWSSSATTGLPDSRVAYATFAAGELTSAGFAEKAITYTASAGLWWTAAKGRAAAAGFRIFSMNNQQNIFGGPSRELLGVRLNGSALNTSQGLAFGLGEYSSSAMGTSVTVTNLTSNNAQGWLTFLKK
jgi:hypothetical protein